MNVFSYDGLGFNAFLLRSPQNTRVQAEFETVKYKLANRNLAFHSFTSSKRLEANSQTF